VNPHSDARASIGHYELLKPIGRGATGIVYLARAEGSDREVAVKVLHGGGGPEAHERFTREVAIAKRLIHRHMVRVLDAGEDDGAPYLVMEMLRGQSLRDVIGQASTGIDVDTAVDLVAQLCVGLHHAHEQGLVHRDVKPANVFLTQEGVVKILDFGVAKLTDSTMTADGSLVGTLAYMAPEQLTGRSELDGRADVFSAGIMLFELLTGRRPFEAESPAAIIARIAHDGAPLPAQLPEPLASLPDLDALLRKALDKDPEQRFVSAQEFAHALWRVALAPRAAVLPKPVVLSETLYADQLRDPLPQTIVAPPPERPAAPRTWLYSGIAAAAVVIIAAGIGTVLWNRSAQAEEPPGPSNGPVIEKPTPTPGPSSGPTPSPPTPSPPAPAPPSPPPITSADLLIESTPPGASIVRDGKTVGQTPARISVTVDDQLRLERSGFENATVKIDAAAIGAGTVAVPLTAIPRVRLRASASYAFELVSGSKVISPAATSHEITVLAGQSVRMRARDFLLDEPIRVGRGPMDVQPPALGTLEVRSVNQTCPVFIAGQNFGPLPLRVRVVAGDYTVEIRCDDGRSGRTRAAVPASGSYQARIDSVR
jgi:serine/threonine-protein kinase